MRSSFQVYQQKNDTCVRVYPNEVEQACICIWITQKSTSCSKNPGIAQTAWKM